MVTNTTEVAPYSVSVKSASKRFGSTQALENVDFELFSGEVHGFAGENGAGKSTLAKIISGQYYLDSGSLAVNGKIVSKWDTATAQKKGIVLIAQELSLVPEMTVAENVYLGIENHRYGMLKNNLDSRFKKLEEKFELGLKGSVKIKTLSIAERQKVEILRALARNAEIIIMDEPTSSLTADEAQKLHSIIGTLRKEGKSIIYVSHFLDSLLDVCDRITIMRDGKVIRTCNSKMETKTSIVESMLGRATSQTFPNRKDYVNNKLVPKIEVKNMSTVSGVKNVSLKVFPGEIVGLAGLVGSGRTEIARAIFGVDSITEGKIFLDDNLYENRSPFNSVKRGIALIPEDRRTQGLVMAHTVKKNISLPHLFRISLRKIINRSFEEQKVKSLVREVNVSPPNAELLVTNFSGGNQQKILFAKWLFDTPSFIILDEPTRGVDIGAKIAIYKIIVELARRGTSILLISSEHAEVLQLSNRVYLVSNGMITSELDPTKATEQDILFKLFGLKTESKL